MMMEFFGGFRYEGFKISPDSIESPRDVADADGENFACINTIPLGTNESSSAEGLASFNVNRGGDANIAVQVSTVVSNVFNDHDKRFEMSDWNPIERGKWRREHESEESASSGESSEDDEEESESFDESNEPEDTSDREYNWNNDSGPDESGQDDNGSEGEGNSEDNNGSDNGLDTETEETSGSDMDSKGREAF